MLIEIKLFRFEQYVKHVFSLSGNIMFREVLLSFALTQLQVVINREFECHFQFATPTLPTFFRVLITTQAYNSQSPLCN